MPHYRLIFSDADLLDEFDAETDAAAHKWGYDASRLVEVPTYMPPVEQPWRRSDFRIEKQDGDRWIVIAGWVLPQRPDSP